MKSSLTTFMMMGTLAATTVGAGIFALPLVFKSAGWGLATFWLIVLGGLVIFAEYSYWRTLAAVQERERLVGLARRHLGRAWGVLATTGVLCGMFLSLIIYLTLAQRFALLVLPLSGTQSLILFWALAILPVTFSIRRFAAIETFGTVLKCSIILFIFFSAGNLRAIFQGPAISSVNIFLPFGAILFALSGWSAIEPMYEIWRGGKERTTTKSKPFVAIVGGVALIAILYFFFAAGILGSLSGISFLSADTLSGLLGWPEWKVTILAVLGLLALWTAYGPTMLEIENVLRKDMRWNSTLTFLLAAALPLLVVMSGTVNILQTVTFSGAIFVGIQYVTIFILAERVLRPRPAIAWTMRVAATIFALAALYEVYIFVIG